MEAQSVWKDCSRFDGMLVLIPLCDVQLPQLTCNPCHFNAILPITLQSSVVLQSNCNPVWLCWLCCNRGWVAWNLQFHHNPKDSKILSQSNLIVVIAVRIAVLLFCVDWVGSSLIAIWGNPGPIYGKRLQSWSNPSELFQDRIHDCVRIAKNLRTQFLRLRGIERMQKIHRARAPIWPLESQSRAIIGVGTILVQSDRNLPELQQDYSKSRIQLHSPGLQISRSRLREDCDNPKELFLGIVGHRGDCRGFQSTRLCLPSSLGSDLTVSR